MKLPSRTWSTVLLMGLVVFCAWMAREALQMRSVPVDDSTGVEQVQAGDVERWFSLDPDGLYHMRRVERFRQEVGLPAAFDPYLNAPEGAVVPWPPYYTMVASALADGSGGRLPLEQSMAELPLFFSLLTTILIAAAAGILAGRRALLLSGLLFAFSYGAIHYSAPGVADHHSFVSMMATALLVLFTLAIRFRAFAVVRRASVFGALCGTLAGALLGSWVGAVLYILPLQLVLAIWLWRSSAEWRKGLCAFGFFFHALALVALGPAILQSPWKAEHPWMVVNLSYFHAMWLNLGALVFLPPLFLKEAWQRWYIPALGILGAIGAGLMLALDLGPAAGLREAFAWSARADQFMASIAESAPLWGPDPYQTGGFARWIGFGVLLLPFALFYAARAIFQRKEEEWWPLLIAVPLLAIQAMAQRRFAEPLAAPLALLLAWWLADVLRRKPQWSQATLASLPAGSLASLACLLLPLMLQAPTVTYAMERGTQSRFDAVYGAERSLLQWLEQAPDAPALGPQDPLTRAPVLAAWDFGHALEWAAQRPSIASNFGSYIGIDSFQAPARFFLTGSAEEAEGVLRQREVAWVMITSRYPDVLSGLCKALGVPMSDYLEATGPGKGAGRRFSAQFFESVGAQVFNLGDLDGPQGPASPLPFLRLAHVSPVPVEVPEQLGGVTSAGRLWQVVRGAQVQVQTAPGTLLRIEIPFQFRDITGKIFLRGMWADEAVANSQGLAKLRVPYATDRNHDAEVVNPTYRLGTAAAQALKIPEQAVLAGSTVLLE